MAKRPASRRKFEAPVFRDPKLNRLILKRQWEALREGDKGWVAQVMVAWQRYYLTHKKTAHLKLGIPMREYPQFLRWYEDHRGKQLLTTR